MDQIFTSDAPLKQGCLFYCPPTRTSRCRYVLSISSMALRCKASCHTSRNALCTGRRRRYIQISLLRNAGVVDRGLFDGWGWGVSYQGGDSWRGQFCAGAGCSTRVILGVTCITRWGGPYNTQWTIGWKSRGTIQKEGTNEDAFAN